MPRLTVIEAGRLMDGTGAEPIDSARIVVEGGRIREVGPASRVKVPQGDVERSTSPRTPSCPGLLDGHVHLSSARSPPRCLTSCPRQPPHSAACRPQRPARPPCRRDDGARLRRAGSDGAEAAGRHRGRRILPGPRILAAGPAITVTGGHCYFFNGEVDSADGMRRWPATRERAVSTSSR